MATKKPKDTTPHEKPPEKPREDRIQAVLARARAAEQAGDRKAALRALDEAPEDLRAFGSWHYARGALLCREGDLEKAIAAFREAVKRDPDIPEVLANLGGTLVERARAAGPGKPVKKADLDEAIALLEKAAALGPKLPNARANLGLAYQLAGRHDDAVAVLEMELQSSPTDIPTFYNYAAALHFAGREAESVAALERLLKVDPGFEPALRSLESARARVAEKKARR